MTPMEFLFLAAILIGCLAAPGGSEPEETTMAPLELDPRDMPHEFAVTNKYNAPASDPRRGCDVCGRTRGEHTDG